MIIRCDFFRGCGSPARVGSSKCEDHAAQIAAALAARSRPTPQRETAPIVSADARPELWQAAPMPEALLARQEREHMFAGDTAAVDVDDDREIDDADEAGGTDAPQGALFDGDDAPGGAAPDDSGVVAERVQAQAEERADALPGNLADDEGGDHSPGDPDAVAETKKPPNVFAISLGASGGVLGRMSFGPARLAWLRSQPEPVRAATAAVAWDCTPTAALEWMRLQVKRGGGIVRVSPGFYSAKPAAVTP